MAQEITVSQLLEHQHTQVTEVQKQSARVLETIRSQLEKVNGSLLTHGALSTVSEFSGKERFTDWMQEIEKCKLIHGLSDKDTCQLAWAKTKGTVSRVVGRMIDEKADLTFSDLKKMLEREYGDIIDKQQAFMKLTGVRQGREEGISSYVERMLRLANQAYGPNWRNDPRDFIEDQLVSIFMEGLRSNDLKMRIYRKQVREIDEAIEIAKTEDLSKKRFPWASSSRQRNEEAMEVEHNRRRGCFKCGGPHRSSECHEVKDSQRKVQVVEEKVLEQDRKYRRCFNCHKPGHFAVKCKQENEGRKHRRCYNCHEPGHFAAQCKQKRLN